MAKERGSQALLPGRAGAEGGSGLGRERSAISAHFALGRAGAEGGSGLGRLPTLLPDARELRAGQGWDGNVARSLPALALVPSQTQRPAPTQSLLQQEAPTAALTLAPPWP